jgi:hypothetical protein
MAFFSQFFLHRCCYKNDTNDNRWFYKSISLIWKWTTSSTKISYNPCRPRNFLRSTIHSHIQSGHTSVRISPTTDGSSLRYTVEATEALNISGGWNIILSPGIRDLITVFGKARSLIQSRWLISNPHPHKRSKVFTKQYALINTKKPNT